MSKYSKSGLLFKLKGHEKFSEFYSFYDTGGPKPLLEETILLFSSAAVMLGHGDFSLRYYIVFTDVPLDYNMKGVGIAARVGRDPMTVSRIWNRWVQDGNTECRAGSQPPPITSSRKFRHVTRMPLMDRAVTSRALKEELGSFARQQMSTRTVRRRLQQYELSARRSWLWLLLTLHHRQERLQWCHQLRTRVHEW
ncbi:HTH_Tnp_Tc3_2 domain-containing protein [Trichonephila clavipes]|nr:HTH_Tnp_Tc3_2 domain-containing protein [Trichonephila clavipes]